LPPNDRRGGRRRGGRRRPLLKEEEERRRMKLYRAGLSDHEMARRLGVHHSTIRFWRGRRGLPPNFKRGGPIPREEEERRLKLYRMGLSDYEIAKAVGVTPSAISNWRHRRGLPAYNPSPRARSEIKEEYLIKAINLYHQHPEWSWERLTYEAFKPPSGILRKYVKEGWRGGLLIETYTCKGKTFKAHKRLDRGIDTWRLEEQYEVPKTYLRKVKEAVGRHLMERCRREVECPFKPLLPEWEEER